MQSCSRLDAWTGRLGWTWLNIDGLGWTWLDRGWTGDGWNVGQGDLVGLGWIWLDLLGHGDFDGWMVGLLDRGKLDGCNVVTQSRFCYRSVQPE